jgi:WhiB family redox-sensing transcriptional regulator
MRRERPWQRDGACAGRVEHADLWFPKARENADQARAVCERCAVRDECLAFAINNNNITDGVWGGQSPSERQHLRRAAN